MRSRLDDPTRVQIAKILGSISILLGLAGMLTLIVLGDWDNLVQKVVAHAGVQAIGFGALALLVLPTQPRNGAVWTLTWSGVFASIYAAGFATGDLIVRATTDLSDWTAQDLSLSELPLSAAIAFWPSMWSWVPAFFLIPTLGLLLFPDGRTVSPRWRWVGWFSVTAVTGVTASLAWVLHPRSTLDPDTNAESLPGVAGTVIEQGFFFIVIGAFLSIVSLIIRYRRSSADVRRQIRLIALGAVGLTATLVNVSPDEAPTTYLFLAGEIFFITTFAIAILKHRLYGLDIVVSKTVTYLSLAAFVAAVYVGLVVGIGELIGGRSSFALSIAATVSVAVAFQPVRRWVQRAANRLVFGERATPYEVLARFSHRAAEVSDAELLARLPQLIVDGTSASQATLWVREEDGYREGATWPEKTEVAVLPSGGSTFSDPDADFSLPVFHADELLGGISLVTSRGEHLTPPETALLEDLAAGMGLALRNTHLTSELRDQVAELEASRERILTAADEARRTLENDLDSGPQQHLVALKVRLGPTRKRAEQIGASQAAALLGQLEAEAGEAIQAVRDFAGGVYPPLLEAEGLVVAITHHARRAAVPISVQGDGIGRYSREIEAAVYFTVLEALQNTTKYAGARSASVEMADTGGDLRFEVRDDGEGFDFASVDAGAGLAGMADRIDTVGGVARVESEPGQGTVVAGSVPVDRLITS